MQRFQSINKQQATTINEWLPIVNQRPVAKTNDTIAVRLASTKANQSMTTTINIGQDVLELLGWKNSMMIEPLQNPSFPLLLKLQRVEDDAGGYKLYGATKNSSRQYLKISLPIMSHALYRVTKKVEFNIGKNEIIMDLTCLAGNQGGSL